MEYTTTDTNTGETWRPLNMEAFKYSYEMSSQGRVRTSPYKVFKGDKTHQTKTRILKEYGEYVYLNSQFSGEYKVATLYNIIWNRKTQPKEADRHFHLRPCH